MFQIAQSSMIADQSVLLRKSLKKASAEQKVSLKNNSQESIDKIS